MTYTRAGSSLWELLLNGPNQKETGESFGTGDKEAARRKVSAGTEPATWSSPCHRQTENAGSVFPETGLRLQDSFLRQLEFSFLCAPRWAGTGTHLSQGAGNSSAPAPARTPEAGLLSAPLFLLSLGQTSLLCLYLNHSKSSLLPCPSLLP